MNVYLIVPVFLNTDLTEAFLRSVSPLNTFERIVIVDDHPEKLHSFLKERENIDVIFGSGSLYWGGSINLGLKYLQGNFKLQDSDIIIIANNDIIINFEIGDFINFIRDDKKSTYHVSVTDNNKKVIKSCGIIKAWFPFIQFYPTKLFEDRIPVDTLTARFLSIPYPILAKTGGIDPRLPHYGGDSDLGLKIKKMGFKNYLLRDFTCSVDNKQTGILSKAKLQSIKRVLTDIKSSYNIHYRWIFVRNHNSLVASLFVFLSMYFKLFIRLTLNTLKIK